MSINDNMQVDWNNNIVKLANGKTLRFINNNELTQYVQQLHSQNITAPTTTQTTAPNIQDIFNKLNFNPTKNNTLNAVHIGDQSIIKFNGTLDKTMQEKLTNSGFKTFKDGNGNMYAMKQDSFMQRNGPTIQTGLAAGGLGLGIANYLDSHKALKKQSALMDEQIGALKDNREHLKSEWARVDKIRKNINSSY